MQLLEAYKNNGQSIAQQVWGTEQSLSLAEKKAQFFLVSHLGLVDRFVVRLLHLLRKWGVEERMMSTLRLALAEALANAVEHGNRLQITQQVIIQVHIDSHKITFLISDQGSGFTEQKTNAQELNRRFAERGRGILMIKSLMDEIRWKKSGKVLEMIKYR